MRDNFVRKLFVGITPLCRSREGFNGPQIMCRSLAVKTNVDAICTIK